MLEKLGKKVEVKKMDYKYVLSNGNSKEVLIDVSYNPKLLGGFILEYNSKSIDASVLKN
jgi:F0F1-type ATP synthase delta subunit